MPINYELLPIAGLYFDDLGLPDNSSVVCLFKLPPICQNGVTRGLHVFVFADTTATFHFSRTYFGADGQAHVYFSPAIKRSEVRQWSYKYRNHITYTEMGKMMGFDCRSIWQKFFQDTSTDSETKAEMAFCCFWLSIIGVLIFTAFGTVLTPIHFSFFPILFYAILLGILLR